MVKAIEDEVGVIDGELVQNLDFSKWAEESMRFAKNHVYKGVEPKGEISQEYLDANLPIAKQRLVLAGHRLAYVLKQMNLEVEDDSDLALWIVLTSVAVLVLAVWIGVEVKKRRGNGVFESDKEKLYQEAKENTI